MDVENKDPKEHEDPKSDLENHRIIPKRKSRRFLEKNNGNNKEKSRNNQNDLETNPNKDSDSEELKPNKNKRKPQKSEKLTTGDSQTLTGNDDDGTVRCMCGYTNEGEMMIQCEDCHVWQHTLCVGIRDEKNIPDKYYCEKCNEEDHPYIGQLPRTVALAREAEIWTIVSYTGRSKTRQASYKENSNPLLKPNNYTHRNRFRKRSTDTDNDLPNEKYLSEDYLEVNSPRNSKSNHRTSKKLSPKTLYETESTRENSFEELDNKELNNDTPDNSTPTSNRRYAYQNDTYDLENDGYLLKSEKKRRSTSRHKNEKDIDVVGHEKIDKRRKPSEKSKEHNYYTNYRGSKARKTSNNSSDATSSNSISFKKMKNNINSRVEVVINNQPNRQIEVDHKISKVYKKSASQNPNTKFSENKHNISSKELENNNETYLETELNSDMEIGNKHKNIRITDSPSLSDVSQSLTSSVLSEYIRWRNQQKLYSYGGSSSIKIKFPSTRSTIGDMIRRSKQVSDWILKRKEELEAERQMWIECSNAFGNPNSSLFDCKDHLIDDINFDEESKKTLLHDHLQEKYSYCTLEQSSKTSQQYCSEVDNNNQNKPEELSELLSIFEKKVFTSSSSKITNQITGNKTSFISLPVTPTGSKNLNSEQFSQTVKPSTSPRNLDTDSFNVPKTKIQDVDCLNIKEEPMDVDIMTIKTISNKTQNNEILESVIVAHQNESVAELGFKNVKNDTDNACDSKNTDTKHFNDSNLASVELLDPKGKDDKISSIFVHNNDDNRDKNSANVSLRLRMGILSAPGTPVASKAEFYRETPRSTKKSSFAHNSKKVFSIPNSPSMSSGRIMNKGGLLGMVNGFKDSVLESSSYLDTSSLVGRSGSHRKLDLNDLGGSGHKSKGESLPLTSGNGRVQVKRSFVSDIHEGSNRQNTELCCINCHRNNISSLGMEMHKLVEAIEQFQSNLN
ncbi:hypothetical protein BB558_000420 [Smittium angustum]|uniref:PHD-type domain-containing protein n=1 Tax=Smittium angustum TaxID=133377 RepID=A0A2U1JE68_SMIAN|nr:hypothetical protein BB558_000420 [Smittium angustum]